MLRQDDFQKSKLVETGWRFGKEYGGHLAACIVMSCIMNRVRAGWGSLMEVLDRIPNFAATSELPTGTPAIWEPDFVRLLQEVDAIYEGSKDFSNGALYWCDSRKITTPFFKERIMGDPENHRRVGNMETLFFFL